VDEEHRAGHRAFLKFRQAAGAGYRLYVAGMVDRKSQGYYERLR
jgi:hypothetical protein